MLLKAYSIRDGKAQFYHTPYYKAHEGEAVRDFQQVVNDEKSTVSKFPEDFDLFHVGEYQTDTGLFSPLESPTHIRKALDLKQV